MPYKAFDGVVDGLAQTPARAAATPRSRALLPREPALLARLFPVFRRVEAIAAARGAGDDAAEPHEQRRRMFGALRELLAALIARRSASCRIDDLQWADADSFLLLRELLRGSRRRRPLLRSLATVRGARCPLDDRRSTDSRSSARELGPLTDDECRALAERLVPGARPSVRYRAHHRARPAATRCSSQEILRHLDSRRRGSDAGDARRCAVGAHRAARPEARALLEVVCIAGAPISLDVAAQACRLDATRSPARSHRCASPCSCARPSAAG